MLGGFSFFSCLFFVTKKSGRRDCIAHSLLTAIPHFVFSDFIASKQKCFSLSSFALEPDKAPPCGSRPFSIFRQEKKRKTGLEPATSTLGRLHSTTELLPHALILYSKSLYFSTQKTAPDGAAFFLFPFTKINYRKLSEFLYRKLLYSVFPNRRQ